MSRNKDSLIYIVDLEPDTGRKIVPVYFQEYVDISLSRIDFRLDSGADITTIRKSDLNRLGYSMEWIDKNKKEAENIKVRMADSTERNGVYVEIPLVSFMEKDFHNFKIFIVPGDNLDYSNLLGLDVSTEFTYTTDNEDRVLEFYRIGRSKFDTSGSASRQIIGEINQP